MNRTKFIEQLLRLDISIDGRSESGCPWFLYRQYANLTGLIDFRCDFVDGQCRRNSKYGHPGDIIIDSRLLRASKSAKERRSLRRKIRRQQVGCCGGCYYNVGYFRCVSHKDINMLAEYFKPEVGFWREGTGCVLPRDKRSTTCLGASCGVSKKTEKHFKVLKHILKTPWTGHHPPEFIDGRGWSLRDGKRRRRWISPEDLEQRIIKSKSK